MTEEQDKGVSRPAPGKGAQTTSEGSAQTGAGARKPALRLVHSVTTDPAPQGQGVKIKPSRNDDDDPGPSAA